MVRVVDGGCDPAAGDQRGDVVSLTEGVWRDEGEPAPAPEGA